MREKNKCGTKSVLLIFLLLLYLICVYIETSVVCEAVIITGTQLPGKHWSSTRVNAVPSDINRRVVKIGVIAPADPHHEQSLPRILPAVALAVKAVSSTKGPLPGWTISVTYRDSKCSSTHGSLAAFDFYINRTAGHYFVINYHYFTLFVLLSFYFSTVVE